MEETWKKWLEAAKQLHLNPKAIVICPECNKGELILKIEPFGDNKEDWYVICNICSKWNVSTKSISEP